MLDYRADFGCHYNDIEGLASLSNAGNEMMLLSRYLADILTSPITTAMVARLVYPKTSFPLKSFSSADNALKQPGTSRYDKRSWRTRIAAGVGNGQAYLFPHPLRLKPLAHRIRVPPHFNNTSRRISKGKETRHLPPR